MALALTQPLTEISASIFLVGRNKGQLAHMADILTAIYELTA
jgi:hypothetical protein